jgi:exoribonuclease-2
MFVLFEEDGAFKTGSLLTDNDTSLQVEMASGKRAKIKAATVLLRFEKPSPRICCWMQPTPLAEECRSGIPLGVRKRWRVFVS